MPHLCASPPRAESLTKSAYFSTLNSRVQGSGHGSGSLGEPSRLAIFMNPTAIAQQKAALRQKIRQQRRSLSYLQQQQANHKLGLALARHPLVKRTQHIALYKGFDNEIDPWAFHHCWSSNKQLYLPVLHPNGSHHLYFLPACPPWRSNRYGITEPSLDTHRPVHLNQLDLILMPLLAFDNSGNRLGAGGGFYDRTLALRSWQKRPYQLGVAYHFQRAQQLPHEAWDQPLDDVIIG